MTDLRKQHFYTFVSRMKRFLYISLLSVVFFACVSKKKYNEARKQTDEKAEEKAVLEEVLNKLAVENDSLRTWLWELDSLYRSEKERNSLASNNPKKEERGLKSKLNKKNISGKDEYNKKAVFIYNFLSYVHWPPDPKTETFNIGIVGDSPIKAPLTGYVYSKSVNKLPIVVETYQPNKVYQILFFSHMGSANFNKIRKQMGNNAVLYITENTLLENIGSHVSLYVDGNKVKYSVNKGALEKSKLKVSEDFYTLSN
jgi:hypothetical protein